MATRPLRLAGVFPNSRCGNWPTMAGRTKICGNGRSKVPTASKLLAAILAALLQLAMPSETEDRLKRRMLQKEHGSIYRAISDILFLHNPMELDGKRNSGDYNPEVDVLVSRIREVENVDALQDL